MIIKNCQSCGCEYQGRSQSKYCSTHCSDKISQANRRKHKKEDTSSYRRRMKNKKDRKHPERDPAALGSGYF